MLHGKDQPMLHYVKELMDRERDRIRDLQAQELDNLKGRQEVETLKLAKALRQERDREDGRDQQQARDQTGRPSQTDTAERRAWEEIREARQRRATRKTGTRTRTPAAAGRFEPSIGRANPYIRPR